MLDIASQEVRRAVRRRPLWRCYYDDLLQDAHEAATRATLRNPEGGGGYVRLCVRGAVLRAGLAYFGVAERSGLTPTFVDPEEAAATPAPADGAADARLALDSLGRAAAPAAPRAWGFAAALAEHEEHKAAATAYGVSRQMGYNYLRELRAFALAEAA